MSRRLCLILLLLGLVAGVSGAPAGSPAVASTVAPFGDCASGPCAGDQDGDGVRDDEDNCVKVRNGAQTDSDGDGPGDACDDNDDTDSHLDAQDNCRTVANENQEDENPRDGIGDACFKDSDKDQVVDERDNCPNSPSDPPNPDQTDLDDDGLGDICDEDDDSDGVFDKDDNCPRVDNTDQTDRDGDGIGTVCDSGESVDGETAPGDTPPGGTAPGAAPAPGTPEARREEADAIAPTLSLSIARTQRRADLEGGMPTSVRCSEACALTAELIVDAATARRLGLGSRTIGRGTAALGGAGRTWVFVRTKQATRKRLLGARGRKVSATLTMRAVDAAGNGRQANKRLTVAP